MANEELDQNIQQELPPEDQNLVEAMQELKANTVQKREYERVLARNKELTDALARNREIEEAAKEAPDTDTIDSLRSDLKNKEMTNMEYWQKVLKLRNKVIESGQPDPFLPSDSKSNYSEENVRTAERVAKGIQNLLDQANGNAELFNALYQGSCEDVTIVRNKNYRR